MEGVHPKGVTLIAVIRQNCRINYHVCESILKQNKLREYVSTNCLDRYNNMTKKLSQLYLAVVAVVSLLTLVYTSFFDVPGMRVTADGVPHLSPPVLNPDTGEPVDLGVLVRHFQGD